MKRSRNSTALRVGTVDLETGVVVKTTAPELRAQALIRDRFIAGMRKGHPLGRRKTTAPDQSNSRHICVSRQDSTPAMGEEEQRVDEALHHLQSETQIITIVGGFSTPPPSGDHARVYGFLAWAYPA